MVKKEDVLVSAFSILFILSVFMVFLQHQKESMTGLATSGATTSNVTISKYLSISLSANLSEGILFGTINTLPAVNINATHNYDGNTSQTMTSFFVNVSSDSNTAVDLCLKANSSMMTVGADVLGVGNETYFNSTVNNITLPGPSTTSVPFTLSYVKAGGNISAGGLNYYRFWLDVPVAQPSGSYNNTINFAAVETLIACP